MSMSHTVTTRTTLTAPGLAVVMVLALDLALVGLLAAPLGCGGAATAEMFPTDPAPAVSGPAWWTFGRDAQHAAIGAVVTQDLNRIVWRKRVDLAPQYQGNELFIHYGSPVITDQNTVVLPIKIDAAGGFRIEARSGGNGALIWSADSAYRLPPLTDWTPSYNVSLSPTGRIYAPTSGGRLLLRDAPDASAGTLQTATFYGADAYAAAPATYDAGVFINTPVTIDAQGDAFFGFQVTGTNPAGLVSGIARLAADGTGTWRAASAAAGDPAIAKAATGSAPALSTDLRTLYVAVNIADGSGVVQSGSLLALDSQTLATQASAPVIDPSTGQPARIADNSTASPTVGPDGDVYFGVLESNGLKHNDRGWLLHFDAALTTVKIPGSFGWDDTASIVSAAMVPSYTGSSAYLLLTKYNNYGSDGIAGDGKNRVAILDPNASQPDAYAATTVMQEVLTILGPTADPAVPGGVREWCINSAAVDPLTGSVLVNSEDGVLYRWDLATNQFSQSIRLTNGLGQAYTPTAIGADGAVYAIGNATLFVVGR
jgi:hypothetical protein